MKKTKIPTRLRSVDLASVRRQFRNLRRFREAEILPFGIQPFELMIPNPEEHIVIVARIDDGKVKVDVTALSFPKEDLATATRLIVEQLANLKDK